MKKEIKSRVMVFCRQVVYGDHGGNRAEIKEHFKEEFRDLTPEQLKAALALLMQYLPLLIELLKG